MTVAVEYVPPAVPFLVEVFDRAFNHRGWVGGYDALSVTVRHNAISTARIDVGYEHPRMADLLEDGARVVITYDGVPIVSGEVGEIEGTLPAELGVVSVPVVGDFGLFFRMLGWPNPEGTELQQGDDGAYWTLTGPAETVCKELVRVNAARLGLPIVVADTQARGATVTASIRMEPVVDKLVPLLEQAGLGMTVTQAGAGWLVDVVVPVTRTQVFTTASGIVAGGSWKKSPPSATRVVVGGGGEGEARTFRTVRDSPAEVLWGVREVFRDARDTLDVAVMTQRGQETLTEQSAKRGLSLVLSETSAMRYGRALAVGDRVTLEIAPGVTVTELVREVTFGHSAGDGLSVVPKVGVNDQVEQVSAKAISGLARRVRMLEAR